MDHEIQLFRNDEFGEVRTVLIDGEPWFVGKDVANILGYTNPLKAIRDHVFEEDKGMNEMFTPGGKQRITVINESGIYCLILSKPIAHACTRMHTKARKNTAHDLVYHGSYSFTQISVNASFSLHSRSISTKSSTLFPFSAIFPFHN